MSCDTKCNTSDQCCAPTEPIKDYPLPARDINYNLNTEIKRCENKIFKGYHCKVHFEKANKLYKRYKKTCNIAYKLHPEKINTTDSSSISDKIKYLFKCYTFYVK